MFYILEINFHAICKYPIPRDKSRIGNVHINLLNLGVPNGHIDYRKMKPNTYYTSLAYDDSLHQYLDSIPIKKKIDDLFLINAY